MWKKLKNVVNTEESSPKLKKIIRKSMTEHKNLSNVVNMPILADAVKQSGGDEDVEVEDMAAIEDEMLTY